MQHEIITAHPLLKADGSLAEAGWARSEVLRYNPQCIIHPAERFKEWHYFFCGDETYGLGMSVSNIGPVHRFSINFLDFKNNAQINDGDFCRVEQSIYKPAASPYASLDFRGERSQVTYGYSEGVMRISIHMEDVKDQAPLVAELVLEYPEGETFFHAFPFEEEPGLFFYCHKKTCIRVSGKFTLDDLCYKFDPQTAFAVEDWGRGVWPAQSVAFWGGACGNIGGKPFGFNLGYDYSDAEAATENVIFYDGKVHKLEHVVFKIQKNETEFDKPWTFTSSDGRFEMTMSPVLVRHSDGLTGPQNQVFGYFSGSVILDDNTCLEIKDIFGFAEKVQWMWGNLDNIKKN